jgi:hypothetical protein
MAYPSKERDAEVIGALIAGPVLLALPVIAFGLAVAAPFIISRLLF